MFKISVMRTKFVLSILITGASCLNTFNLQTRFFNLIVCDGLSNSWVNCIIQNQQEFMGFASDDVLNKYDGKDFKVYRRIQGNPSSFWSNFVI